MISVDLKITGEIAALKLSPGDVVVVSLNLPLPGRDELERLVGQLRSIFPGHKVLLVPEGMAITVVRDEALARARVVQRAHDEDDGLIGPDLNHRMAAEEKLPDPLARPDLLRHIVTGDYPKNPLTLCGLDGIDLWVEYAHAPFENPARRRCPECQQAAAELEANR